MNTTALSDDDELRAAEYALGVLNAAQRAQIEEAMRHDPALAAAILRWQQRLGPLAEDIVELAPPPHVWHRIESTLSSHRSEQRTPVTHSVWDNLRLWRWLGIGSTAIAAALAVVLVVSNIRRETLPIQNERYIVASLAHEGGAARWTATVDVQTAQVIVVPATAAPIPADRSTELWLIPPGGQPIALGLIPSDRPTIVAVPRERLARLAPKTLLAVSLEPRGGSPTGQPTGPVLAAGELGHS